MTAGGWSRGTFCPATADSFAACYAANVTDALRLARTLTRDREQAEDAVAEAFAKVFRRWAVGGIHRPHAYVRRAVANEVVSGFRRRGRERAVLARTWQDTTTGDAAEGVCERDAVDLLLAVLPPRQRVAVTLRYLEDLSVAEVARRMGTSAGTVKSNTARGLDALRAALGPPVGAADPPAGRHLAQEHPGAQHKRHDVGARRGRRCSGAGGRGADHEPEAVGSVEGTEGAAATRER